MSIIKRPKSPKGDASLAQNANDISGAAKKPKPALSELAVPIFDKVGEYTDLRAQLILDNEESLTLDDVQKLMTQVQLAQRNLTEGLNNLKAYRKVVSQILETRRREAAAARRQAAKSGKSAHEAPIEVTGSADFEAL